MNFLSLIAVTSDNTKPSDQLAWSHACCTTNTTVIPTSQRLCQNLCVEIVEGSC